MKTAYVITADIGEDKADLPEAHSKRRHAAFKSQAINSVLACSWRDSCDDPCLKILNSMDPGKDGCERESVRSVPVSQRQSAVMKQRIKEKNMGKESGGHIITTEMTANELLERIFENILPQYEMPLRRKQEEFALFILESLLHRRLALAEAGVGIGKTHAYLIASIVYNLYTDNRLPVVIATSTAAQQEAITNIYLPQLSKILTKSGVLDRRLTFTVRKGKKHYICDKRLEKYRRETDEKKRGEEGMLLKKMENAGWKEIDLDRWEVPPFIKRRICVQHCRKDCPARNRCRYQMVLNDGRKAKYDFLVVNHGYILGDLLREKEGRRSQLPEYDVLIFDEAHKLRDTARQTYGITLSEKKLLNLAGHLEEGSESARRRKKRLMEKMLALFDAEEEGEINKAIRDLSRELAGWQRQNVPAPGDAKKEQMIRNLCEKLLPKLLMMRKDDQILWKERAGNGDRQICSLSEKLNGTLCQDLASLEEVESFIREKKDEK